MDELAQVRIELEHLKKSVYATLMTSFLLLSRGLNPSRRSNICKAECEYGSPKDNR